MQIVTFRLDGKRVYLLSGARRDPRGGALVEVEAIDELRELVKRVPEAVAFGLVRGRWVDAA